MKIATLLLASLLSFTSVWADNTFQTPDFNFPQDVDARARVVLDSALQVGNDNLVLQSLAQISLAQNAVSKRQVEPSLALIDSVINLNRLAPDYKALLYVMAGRLVSSLPGGKDDKSEEMRHWSSNKLKELAQSHYQHSMDPLGNGDRSVLKQPIDKYAGTLTLGDSYGERCIPTLYDFLCLNICSYGLPYGKPARKQLVKEWRAFHAKDADKLPLAYIDYQEHMGSDYIYKKYGRREELGIFLCTMTTGKKTEEDYLKRHPNSPFCAQISAHLAYKNRQIVYTRATDLLSSADSIPVYVTFLNNKNCKLLLYRLEGRMPADADLVRIDKLTLVDSLQVSCGKKNKEVKACFAPKPVGRYFVLSEMTTPEGPYRTTNFTGQQLEEIMVSISDLRTFDVSTYQKREVFVVDARTGKPVEGARVTAIYSDYASSQKRAFFTDAEGRVSLPSTWGIDYTIAKGEDDLLYNYRLWPRQKEKERIKSTEIFTDLAIYRPGETVQFTAIAYEEESARREVLRDYDIKFYLFDNKRQRVDSLSVRTDSLGQASGEFVMPVDRQNGSYSIVAYKTNERETLGSHSIQLSEYKLPQYFIDFSDTKQKQSHWGWLKVKGKVLSYSGLPVPNADVTLEVDYDKEYELTTDKKGRFSKRSWIWRIKPYHPDYWKGVKHVRFSAECETDDGDFAEADSYIIVGKNKVKPSKPLKRSEPYLLWVPQEERTVDEENVAHAVLHTSYNTPVYYAAYNGENEVVSGWLNCQPGANNLDFQLPADGVETTYLNLYACYNGQQERQIISLVQSQKKPVKLRTVSFRDKITPGEKEHWSFSLLDADNQPVQGRMMLELYNKALDDLKKNPWKLTQVRPLYNPVGSRSFYSNNWKNGSQTYIKPVSFQPYQLNIPDLNLWRQDYRKLMSGQPADVKPRKMVNGYVLDENLEPVIGASVIEADNPESGTVTDIDGYFSMDLKTPGSMLKVSYIGYAEKMVAPSSDMTVCLMEDTDCLNEVVVVGYGVQKKELMTGSTVSLNTALFGAKASQYETIEEALAGVVAGVSVQGAEPAVAGSPATAALEHVQPRLGDVHVALWRPSIQSDENGNFTLDFDVVNENTTWCLQALAYTSDLSNDLYCTEVLAQRRLMVQPSLPRFLRAGDVTQLRTAVENATDSLQHITATFELFNPRTNKTYSTQQYQVAVPAKGRETLTIACKAPYDTEFLGIRVKAVNALGDSDGEQQQIIVLPATSAVTESQPFFLKPDQPTITLDVPVAAIDSTSMLTLSYCNNPVEYCAEALPVIIEDNHVTSSGIAHALYASVVADKIRETTGDYTALIKKLAALQHADGGMLWINTGREENSSRWATGEVIELLGNLQQLHYLPADETLHRLTESALQYLDRDICQKNRPVQQVPETSVMLDYAYIRTLFAEGYAYENDSVRSECERYIGQTVEAAAVKWRNYDLPDRAFAAMMLQRMGNHAAARTIVESLRQLAVYDEGRGMYWEHLNVNGYYHPVANTALMLQAFAEVAPEENTESIEAMRQWLLLEKQTSQWGKYSMASHAIHGLLCSGIVWDDDNHFEISIDDKAVDVTPVDEKKGLVELEVPLSAHQVKISRSGNHPAWGALFHNHTLPVEQIVAERTKELSIRKELLVQKEEGDEKKWIELEEYGQPLKKGDHVKVRLVIICDKDLDCLALRDDRPAFLEPVDYLSGYRWNWGESGYYQEVKDTCMNLYFCRLREGSHAFTYECIITQEGTFSAGMVSIESQQAPEFRAHSEGAVIEVK